jgi:hypothetical protein
MFVPATREDTIPVKTPFKSAATRSAVFAACLLAACGGDPANAAATLEGNAVRSGRVSFTIDGTGLPAGIAVAARPDELPLASREGGAPAAEVLATIGRGPLLRGPVRLEAMIGGKPVAAAPTEAAKPAAAGDAVRAAAKAAAGPLSLTTTADYRDAGRIDLTIVAKGDATVDGLQLVLPVAGVVDLAIPLAAAAAAAEPPLGAFTPAEIDGVAWSNVAGNGSKQVVAAPGVAAPLFFGSGDRGFVITVPDAKDWPIDPAKASFELVRDKQGAVEARWHLCNRPQSLAAERKFAFSIQVLPASAAAVPGRLALWQKPPAGVPAAKALEGPVVEGVVDVPESVVKLGDGRIGSTEVFRYVCGAPAGLPGVVRADAAAKGRAGGDPGGSRILIGRAVSHGLVVDGGTIAHRADLLRAVGALAACGILDEKATVETVPPWRSGGVARYGEEFASAGGFEVTPENPVARVHTTAFILPRGKGASGPRQTLFVIVNEGDKPVREQFYVTKPLAAFGGPNRASAKGLVGGWDYAGLPADSDWRRDVLVAATPGSPALVDLEDGGFVAQTKATPELEVYGPLFVPARGYRMVWGCGDAGPLPGAGAGK